MSEVSEFLKARLDEDEQCAQAMQHRTVPGEPYYSCAGSRTEPYGDLEWGEDACDCFLVQRRARALREVAAKRAILDAYELAAPVPGETFTIRVGQARGLGIAVRHLAGAWSDHPEYRPEWAHRLSRTPGHQR